MILAAEQIMVVRQNARVVLDGVSCRVQPGRLTGIIGPNGAGKSTLLQAMAGLVPITAGGVALNGKAVSTVERRALARAIAYLPQERSVHWPLPVRAIVALGRLPHRHGPAGDSAADAAAIDAAIAVMDLATLADRPADRISGGELGRTLVARALAQEAHVILADEPAAGLDPAHALALFQCLRRLAAEGRAIAVALHDLSLAARFCDDLVVLANGRLVAAGLPEEVLTSSRLEPVFGVGFVTGALEGVPVVIASDRPLPPPVPLV